MLVPAPVVELDKADSAFGESPRQDAIGGKASRFARLRTIKLEGRGGFAREVGQFGYRGLHPKGQFVVVDPGLDLRVLILFEVQSVQLTDIVQHSPAHSPIHSGGIAEEEHRVFAWAESNPLVMGRKEACAPHPLVQWLGVGRAAGAGDHHHEGGKVPVFTSQSVGEPGSHRWPSGLLVPRLKEGHGRIVVDGLGVHRADETQLVGDAGGVWQQFAEQEA